MRWGGLELELGDLNRCPSGLVSRDLGREAMPRVGTVFKQNKDNRGPGENKIPTGTEIRVAGGSWESLRLPHSLVVAVEIRLPGPQTLAKAVVGLFGPFLCLLCGTWCISEPGAGRCEGARPLGKREILVIPAH